MSATSTATIIPTTRTGGSGSGADRDNWIRTRHRALVDELVRRGTPWSRAWAVAMAPVAHWGDETGWGHSEWNFAIGNVRSVGQCFLAHMLQGSDDPVPRPYCAYRSLAEGVAATTNLLTATRPNYLAPWNYLLSTGDAVGWFQRLLHAGWHPYSEASVASFRSEYARVVRTVGADPGDPGGGNNWWYAALAVAVGAGAYIILADD